MAQLLLRNATVLTFDDDGRRHARADILVEQGRIALIGPDLAPPDAETNVVDATGRLAIPGLINAHLHSPANFLKGTLEGAPLEILMLHEVPPLAELVETPELVRLRTLSGAAELLPADERARLDAITPQPAADLLDLYDSFIER